MTFKKGPKSMKNLFRAYIKTAEALKKQNEYLKAKIKETTDVDEKKALLRRSDTLYAEYLDVLYSAKLIESQYFKKGSLINRGKKGTLTYK